MSYLVVKYKAGVKDFIDDFGDEIEKEMVGLTSKLFDKKPEEIMVDFELFGTYEGSRDILVRGETSDKNKQLLPVWAEEIKKVFMKYNFGKPVRVGIKTYSVMSSWQEIELKILN